MVTISAPKSTNQSAYFSMPENIAKFRHHGQHKVAPHLADGLDTLATHLLHGAEYMLDARPHLGRFFEAPSSQKILLLFE